MSMNILVAGGSGFIGSNLVPKLVNSGCFVGVLDVKTLDIGFPLDSSVHFFEASVNSIPPEVYSIDWDVVVNLAAVSSVPACEADPGKAFDVNVKGSTALLDLALSKGASFILASSAAVFGECENVYIASTTIAPMSVYGKSKLQAEFDTFQYASSANVPVSVFRFFNVFGPHQFMCNPKAVIPSFLYAAASGLDITVHNSGLPYRDFIPVDFVSDIIVESCLSKFSYREPISVCSGVPRSILSVAELVSCFTNPPSLIVVSKECDPASLVYSVGDPSLISSLFPKVTAPDFNEYLRYCFEFVSKNST